MAKVTLNLDKCVACGRCVDVCPGTFETDMNTLKVAVINGTRNGDIWSGEAGNAECARDAAEGCLMGAITVE
jgi:ferredoxin